MKLYKVDVQWTQTGTMWITAKSKAEAKRLMEQGRFDDITNENGHDDYEALSDIEETDHEVEDDD